MVFDGKVWILISAKFSQLQFLSLVLFFFFFLMLRSYEAGKWDHYKGEAGPRGQGMEEKLTEVPMWLSGL